MSINISGFNPFVLFTLLLTSCGGQQETQEKDEDFKGNKYSDLNFVDDTNDDLKNILFTRLNWAPSLLKKPSDIATGGSKNTIDVTSTITFDDNNLIFKDGQIKDLAKQETKDLDIRQIFKRIYNRTFVTAFLDGVLTLEANYKNATFSKDKIFMSRHTLIPEFRLTVGQSMWLIDFAFNERTDQYKLFFATDLSTADKIRNFGMYQPSTNLYGSNLRGHNNLLSFWLGKGRKEPDLAAKTSEVEPIFYSKYGVSYNIFEDLKWPDKREIAPWKDIISRPKIVFAAVDFLEAQGGDKDFLIPLWILNFNDVQNGFPFEKRDKDPPKLIINYDYRPLAYKDIAIIELDYDEGLLERSILSSTARGKREELIRFKGWIHQAIEEVLKEKGENKRLNLANKDNLSPQWWERIDPVSLLKYSKNKIKNIDYDQRLYYGGYSVNNFYLRGKERLPVWENHILNYDKKASSNEEGYILTDLSITDYTIDFMNTFAHRYGFGGYLLRDKEKNKGVSTVTGALVVNRQAQPVGLISSRKLFGSYDPSDKNKNGFVNVFDNFQQLQDITVDYKTTNEDLKPPFAKTAVTKNYLRYNLIDNSKTKELGQKNSYRKALNDLYPDGIFYGIFKTSLFDDYRF